MEILDYLRAKGPKLAILVLLPFLAGAVAFYFLAGQPVRYEGDVQVTVPGALASGGSGLGLYIANFRQAVDSREISDRVVAATGVDEDELEELEVRQVGQANRIELSFVSTSADLVASVPLVAAQAALEELAQADVDYQRSELAVAEERYAQARAEIDRFSADTGLLFPEDAYRAAGEQLRDLEQQLAEAEATGFTVTAASLRPRIDEVRARRDVLGQQLLVHQQLVASLENANSARRTANGELVQVEAELALSRSPDLIGEVETRPVPRTQTLLGGVGLAALVAFLLALGILALPDLRRRPAPARQEAGRAAREAETEWLGVYVADDELVESRRTRAR